MHCFGNLLVDSLAEVQRKLFLEVECTTVCSSGASTVVFTYCACACVWLHA